MPDKNFGILLLGYNRPELVIKRLNELRDNKNFCVYVSIDGGSGELISRAFLKMQDYYLLDNSQEIKFFFQQENLGLVKHLTSTITKIFKEVENLIVIEDDILMSRNYVENIINIAKDSFKQEYIATVGGFSPLTNRRFFKKTNKWRESQYFSAWGWCISGKIWRLYNHVLDLDKIEAELSASKSWNNLSNYQKKVWTSRFQKVAKNPDLTWDYQMQYLTFKFDLVHILPTFRISDNEGFLDIRSTNTKLERPRWMGSSTFADGVLVKGKVSKLGNSILQFIDSLTIGGDRKILKLRASAFKIPELYNPYKTKIRTWLK